MEANPPHGQKGDFLKVTVTLPPKIYRLIMAEVIRRKMHKERNPQLSAVIREAVVSYLERAGTAASGRADRDVVHQPVRKVEL